MRIKLPEFSSQKDRFAYLIANKERLIEQKKLLPVISDAVTFGVQTVAKSGFAAKANHPVDEDVDKLTVRVVMNTANWIDSHFDMLLPDAAKKSIQERKDIIPHLHDHIHKIEAKLGEVIDITLPMLSFEVLGIEGNGSTQAIVFETELQKSDNEKVFNQYKQGRINQHSIALQLLQVDLAINDETSEKEFDFWTKHFDAVINKEVAEEFGFFWVVQEFRLIEGSAVLFGANVITPTLDNNVKLEPSLDTPPEPEQSTQKDMSKYLNLILQ